MTHNQINVGQIIIIANSINFKQPKLQRARVLDELERNQKKENHLQTISKMMGTLVPVRTLNGHFSRPAETDPYVYLIASLSNRNFMRLMNNQLFICHHQSLGLGLRRWNGRTRFERSRICHDSWDGSFSRNAGKVKSKHKMQLFSGNDQIQKSQSC